MAISKKIIVFADLEKWRRQLPERMRPIVVTNGCFDLVHPGHVNLLEQARTLGNSLLVGVNSDACIRELKGPGRPVLNEEHRIAVLAGLEAVTAVCVFPGLDARELIVRSRPDIYVKGGNYTIDTINQYERRLLEKLGASIQILSQFGSHSTTGIVKEITKKLANSSRVKA